MIEALKSIIGDESRIIAGDIPDKYLSDTLGRRHGTAAALVFPVSTDEVAGVMRYAWEHSIPVTPRGAGTNLVGSTVPHGEGIVLDLSRMNHVLEIDEETFTATVEPGVVLEDFQSMVEAKGLFYPPDPGEKTATIAGNIATNAGGMRAVKYGVTRDYVRGLEVVTADGRVITAGTKNVKDASGLSLKHLIVGSEGTLGVITKCILRLVPKPEVSRSALVPFGDLQTGISSVLKIIKANANPTAIEFIERSVVELGESFTGQKFPCPEAKAYILLTFDGTSEQVDAGIERVKAVTKASGAIDFIELTDPAQAAAIWRVRGCLVKAVEAFSEQEPVDLVVPINRTAEFIEFVHKLEAESGMQMIAFGHAGDGNVHLCVVRGKRSDEEWEHELKANMTRLYNKAYELGGLTSGEHGIGLAKRPYFLANTNENNLEVMRAIKDALDAKHILNDHISYLK